MVPQPAALITPLVDSTTHRVLPLPFLRKKTRTSPTLSIACYILNRDMLRPTVEKTPYELLRGRKLTTSHMRSFGCKCFIHNNGKDNLGKFDSRSDEGVFIGYSMRSSAYKVYNKRLMKIEESIHVTFDENRRGNENLLDSEEEEFIFQSSL